MQAYEINKEFAQVLKNFSKAIVEGQADTKQINLISAACQMEMINLMAHISKQLEEIYMEIPNK